MAAVGRCVLGEKPRVALALCDSVQREDVDPYIARGVDMVEMRIDHFSNTSPAYVLAHLRKFSGIPRIGTIRLQQEGGGWQHDEKERLALYQEIIPAIEAVDIEINADFINNDVIRCAKQKGVTVIGSFHDFEKTPDEDTLHAILHKGKSLGVDIVKVASHCVGQADMRILARLLLEHEQDALIVIGMGAAAMASRILFPALGSLITYTFLGEPSAPGQFNCDETIRHLKTLCLRTEQY